jgi:cytoskeletal protein CcmA (bactofilin family)
MFGSNPRTSLGSNETSNYNSAPNRLSGDVSIKGNVVCGSELVIEGEVDGTITSTGTLTIGAQGKVIGDIEAGFITIQGSVEGNVLARERCALKAGSNLQGDVAAPRLAVDETASFVGKATITANRA